MSGVKIVDLLNASFAAGEMPGSTGMVDTERAREMGYLVGTARDDLLGALNGEEPAPVERLPCPVVVVTRTEDTGFASIREVWYHDGGTEPVDGTDTPVERGPVAVSTSLSDGDFAVLVPAGSTMPDEPEFSSWGASARATRIDKFIPIATVAAVMARKVPMEVLPGEDAADHAAAVLEALQQTLALGDDLAEVLGIVTPVQRSADSAGLPGEAVTG